MAWPGGAALQTGKIFFFLLDKMGFGDILELVVIGQSDQVEAPNVGRM